MADPQPDPPPPTRGPDLGPIYTETPAEIRDGQPYAGIAEPWNTVTAAFFIVIVLFWVVRLHGRWRRYPFLASTLPILFVGGVGGTLYHGLRNWVGYFLLDLIPINILGLAVSIYVWVRLGPRLVHLLGALALLGTLMAVGRLGLPPTWAVNMSYAGIALIILLPIGAALLRTRFRHGGWVTTAVVAFAIAWFCRLIDHWQPPLLPMGTHWLWHTFGAATTLALSEYVYRIEGLSLKVTPPPVS